MNGYETALVIVGILAANTPFYVIVLRHEGKLVRIESKLEVLVDLVRNGAGRKGL